MLTPIKAIRAKCLDCCCGSAKEVELCPSILPVLRVLGPLVIVLLDLLNLNSKILKPLVKVRVGWVKPQNPVIVDLIGFNASIKCNFFHFFSLSLAFHVLPLSAKHSIEKLVCCFTVLALLGQLLCIVLNGFAQAACANPTRC